MEELFAKIMEVLSSVSGASATIAIVLEFAFRLIPSEKPKSIIYLIASAAKSLGGILIKAGELLDKVLPQTIKIKE
jgi:hypothetical protein